MSYIGKSSWLRVYQFLLNSFTLFIYIYFNTEVNNQFNDVHLPEADRITQMWSS